MVPVRSVRLFEIDDCGIEAVLRAKGTSTVSLCIPCRDEAATIGSLVSIIRAELMRKVPRPMQWAPETCWFWRGR